MVERHHPGPLPPVHPDPHGRPPVDDGTQAVRRILKHQDTRTTQQYAESPPQQPPVTFGERLTAAICVCIVLVAIAIGSLR